MSFYSVLAVPNNEHVADWRDSADANSDLANTAIANGLVSAVGNASVGTTDNISVSGSIMARADSFFSGTNGFAGANCTPGINSIGGANPGDHEWIAASSDPTRPVPPTSIFATLNLTWDLSATAAAPAVSGHSDVGGQITVSVNGAPVLHGILTVGAPGNGFTDSFDLIDVWGNVIQKTDHLAASGGIGIPFNFVATAGTVVQVSYNWGMATDCFATNAPASAQADGKFWYSLQI
jgi:hypothetical protein